MTEPANLSKMFSDPGWHRISRNLYFRNANGQKFGVVLATVSPGWETLALNQSETERVLNSKRDGRIDRGHIVAAKRDGGGPPTFIAQVDAEEFYQSVLKHRPTKSGAFGPFWVVYEYEFGGDDMPM
jgi:hypothetical protein